mmetsp:Transcript_26313/g.77209  ORF Transcript_26313/g.77209 Transcript_26313/m.77209 type:complete len:379 (-) Transcript_26313:511-1647(-)
MPCSRPRAVTSCQWPHAGEARSQPHAPVECRAADRAHPTAGREQSYHGVARGAARAHRVPVIAAAAARGHRATRQGSLTPARPSRREEDVRITRLLLLHVLQGAEFAVPAVPGTGRGPAEHGHVALAHVHVRDDVLLRNGVERVVHVVDERGLVLAHGDHELVFEGHGQLARCEVEGVQRRVDERHGARGQQPGDGRRPIGERKSRKQGHGAGEGVDHRREHDGVDGRHGRPTHHGQRRRSVAHVLQFKDGGGARAPVECRHGGAQGELGDHVRHLRSGRLVQPRQEARRECGVRPDAPGPAWGERPELGVSRRLLRDRADKAVKESGDHARHGAAVRERRVDEGEAHVAQAHEHLRHLVLGIPEARIGDGVAEREQQ